MTSLDKLVNKLVSVGVRMKKAAQPLILAGALAIVSGFHIERAEPQSDNPAEPDESGPK